MGYKMPPQTIDIDPKKNTTVVNAYAAFSSEYIHMHNRNGVTDFDIQIALPHSDYLVDVELKTDFLTNRMHMKLLALDE